jgi:RNA polymerase primary sigma factor
MTRVEVSDEQIKAAQDGDSMAMWEIVQGFDPMFAGMIRSVAPGATAEDAEDLLQEARALLIQRIRDYDSDSSSATLTSYVYRAIRRRMAEEHVEQTTALSVDPSAVLRVRRALWEAKGDVEAAWASVSSADNGKARMERERFMSVLECLAPTERLDGPAGGQDADGSDLVLAEVIADPAGDMTNVVERRDYARWLMTQIAPRQSLALRLFYGVNMERMEDAAAADELGVTRNNLRQLRNAGCASARRVAVLHGHNVPTVDRLNVSAAA